MRLSHSILNGFHNFRNNGSWYEPRGRRIRGSYERTRFVLRLAPEVHELLATSDLTPGEFRFTASAPQLAEAMSTYIHETIHWWQHIGSFAGFVQSNTFPSATHLNHRRLLNILGEYGPQKSIYKLLELRSGKAVTPSMDDLNIVVNNYKVINFFVLATQDPKNLSVIAGDKYFEGRGHAFIIAYQALMSALSTFDPHFAHLPSPEHWEKKLGELKRARVPEFYFGSAVRRPPIGLHAILEGQARMSQLQYLYLASGRSCGWQDFADVGMLGNVYTAALNLFLYVLKIPLPDSPESPVITLFLLICDLAINPTDGFPLQIHSFTTFLDDVDPGTRFHRLCQAARAEPGLLMAINRFSKVGYLKVSERLCELADIIPPREALAQIVEWKTRSTVIAKVVRETKTLEFDPVNMPLRLLFSRFLAFCEDKARFPEFFCWPGPTMTSEYAHDQAIALFKKHQSLFSNRSDRRGIFPRLIEGVDPVRCTETLNVFYIWNAIYDMTQQWVTEEGVFDLSFDWLLDGSNEDIYQWANDNFFNFYQVRPEDFKIL